MPRQRKQIPGRYAGAPKRSRVVGRGRSVVAAIFLIVEISRLSVYADEEAPKQAVVAKLETRFHAIRGYSPELFAPAVFPISIESRGGNRPPAGKIELRFEIRHERSRFEIGK